LLIEKTWQRPVTKSLSEGGQKAATTITSTKAFKLSSVSIIVNFQNIIGRVDVSPRDGRVGALYKSFLDKQSPQRENQVRKLCPNLRSHGKEEK
jgi:hypothetical protein